MIGLLRVKNESRWIGEVLRSIAPVCAQIYVFDDHSTDETPALARAAGCVVWHSAFEGLDEARDKEWMLEQLRSVNPDWVLAIDGDEVLTPDSVPIIREAQRLRHVARYSFQILYLWDAPDQIRVDGVYGNFRRTSMFRFAGQARSLRYMRTGHGGNFHCKNSPANLQGEGRELDARLLHYGYMDREDRLRKYLWYNERDPQAVIEDGYRHMVQGDLPEIGAHLKLRHAGPLELRPLQEAYVLR